jgi:hypothetical protein
MPAEAGGKADKYTESTARLPMGRRQPEALNPGFRQGDQKGA